MPFDLEGIADRADMIINGYAFTKDNGDTTVEKTGMQNEREIRKIRKFIKLHYKEMYIRWQQTADTGFYGEK